MKKQILNLGKALNKAEQKVIHGGDWLYCNNPGIYGDCTESECEILGGIWYACNGSCFEANVQHFAPC